MTAERFAEEGLPGAVFSVRMYGLPVSMQVMPNGKLSIHARSGVEPDLLYGLRVANRVFREVEPPS